MKKSIAAMIFCAVLPMCTEDCQGMVEEQGEPDFIAPLGAFINWGCDQENIVDVAQTWVTLVTIFKSSSCGERGYVNDMNASDINMHGALRDYFKYFQSNGTYDRSIDPRAYREAHGFLSECPDHEADGILSKYPAFAEAFGNSSDPSKPECYYVAAKGDERNSPDERGKYGILVGIAEDFTLDCDGNVGNTRKTNACLQLLLLTELAQSGTANRHDLDAPYNRGALGYNQTTLSKFWKLMSIIMEE
jgi:hypothetical protein